jgi:hypothetical protein
MPGSKNQRWSDFLFEFVLLFLAVTAGFFIDNFREKLAEKDSEKTHMRMLVNDLNEDVYRLDSNSVIRCRREKKLDTLIRLLAATNISANAPALYRLALSVDIYETFFRNDRTIIQFKNAGGMTMIHNDSVSAAIMDYDGYIISEIDWNNNIEAACIARFKEIRYQLFDAQLINSISGGDPALHSGLFRLLPATRADINAIAGTVFQMKRISTVNRDCGNTARNKASKLIELITRQYRLGNIRTPAKATGCYD